MKYRANPVEVEAHKIVTVGGKVGDDKLIDGQVALGLEDGSTAVCSQPDDAEVGDFLITWPDGEMTVYPAEEFNSRFSPEESIQAA
jgi:hypothetical protein